VKALQVVIDQIWDKYDKDSTGELDKQEFKKYIQDTLGREDEISDDAYEEVFRYFDKNDSGTIDKAEIVFFVKSFLSNTEE
jgi:Ca2+-binding EF-hand superfamily protein